MPLVACNGVAAPEAVVEFASLGTFDEQQLPRWAIGVGFGLGIVLAGGVSFAAFDPPEQHDPRPAAGAS